MIITVKFTTYDKPSRYTPMYSDALLFLSLPFSSLLFSFSYWSTMNESDWTLAVSFSPLVIESNLPIRSCRSNGTRIDHAFALHSGCRLEFCEVRSRSARLRSLSSIDTPASNVQIMRETKFISHGKMNERTNERNKQTVPMKVTPRDSTSLLSSKVK